MSDPSAAILSSAAGLYSAENYQLMFEAACRQVELYEQQVEQGVADLQAE